MEVREDGFKIYNNNVGGRKVGTFPFDINVFGESLGWSYGIESAKNSKVIRVGNKKLAGISKLFGKLFEEHRRAILVQRSLVLKDMEYSALGKSQKSGSGIGMGLTGGGM
ncbi:hypothetical protein Tco_0680578 [Tanacetum coccineum]|uniref:Uncharacterized protein n=1 Tax=Tanacetum coccineum TaxID=301880 RepID=A0ABQ4XL84_9ASTR